MTSSGSAGSYAEGYFLRAYCMLIDGPDERFDGKGELFTLIRLHPRTEVRKFIDTTRMSAPVEIEGHKAPWDIVGLVRHLGGGAPRSVQADDISCGDCCRDSSFTSPDVRCTNTNTSSPVLAWSSSFQAE